MKCKRTVSVCSQVFPVKVTGISKMLLKLMSNKRKCEIETVKLWKYFSEKNS
jgi:hypothetical protein